VSDPDGQRETERVISRLLMVGVVASTAVVLFGGIVFLARHGAEPPKLGAFRGEPAELRTLHGVVSAAGAFEARAIIQLGLGLLVATPVAREAFALFAFLRQRDVLYATITSVVLAVLLLSLLSAGPP
jgi:uncharacterized membrane protein